ncbi:MAG: diguanylate cyclase [Desulfobacteraceae bacterium]|nr:diguanylate cyclase [Desulfobacteraceae bacterium]
MSQILLVEDSDFFGTIVKKEIETKLNFEVVWVKTYSDTLKLLSDNTKNFFIGLLDLNLPDALEGEIVDMVISKNIPSIVFTGEFSDEVRDHIWSKRVIDYVLKEGPHNITYLISLIRNIFRNKKIKVLVVDDSKFSRKQICDLLAVHRYHLFEAGDGIEALRIIKKNPDIKMVITDYSMPNMDGFRLTNKIRLMHSKEELAIIGISARGSNILSAKFIKNGANDFIAKPFLTEEFYCRVSQNIDIIEQFDMIKNLSNQDYLTGLCNRRYFFETGDKLYENINRQRTSITIAMIDIDDFKRINDTFGHEAGDKVITNVAHVLRDNFRKTDIVSRFGGEEFCVLAKNMDQYDASKIFDQVRKAVESSEVDIDGKKINVTVSVGVCSESMESLEAMIKQADLCLYKAKQDGKNMVVIDNFF